MFTTILRIHPLGPTDARPEIAKTKGILLCTKVGQRGPANRQAVRHCHPSLLGAK